MSPFDLGSDLEKRGPKHPWGLFMDARRSGREALQRGEDVWDPCSALLPDVHALAHVVPTRTHPEPGRTFGDGDDCLERLPNRPLTP